RTEAAIRGEMIEDDIKKGYHPSTAVDRVEDGTYDTWEGEKITSEEDSPGDVDPRYGLSDRQAAAVDVLSQVFGLGAIGTTVAALGITTESIIAKTLADLDAIQKKSTSRS